MKLLFVIPYISPLYGGPTVAINKILEVLPNNKYEITILTSTANGNLELNINTNDVQIINNVRYYYFNRFGPKFLLFCPRLFFWLVKNIELYNLIHIHCVFNLFSLQACLLSKYYNIPNIVSPHGALDPFCLFFKWWKKYPYLFLFERFNLKNASLIHVTSNIESKSISKLGFSSKIFNIPLCVNIPNQTYRNSDSKFLKLLFISRLEPIKGLPILFNAISIINKTSNISVNLKIIGNGEPKYQSELMKLANKLGISSQIIFMGFLNENEISNEFLDCHIFVLPSFHENFSLVTAEALAHGVPVIISDQVGIASDVFDSNAGDVISANSPQCLSRSISKYADPLVRAKASIQARKLAEKNYSQEIFGIRLNAMYRKVITQN